MSLQNLKSSINCSFMNWSWGVQHEFPFSSNGDHVSSWLLLRADICIPIHSSVLFEISVENHVVCYINKYWKYVSNIINFVIIIKPIVITSTQRVDVYLLYIFILMCSIHIQGGPIKLVPPCFTMLKKHKIWYSKVQRPTLLCGQENLFGQRLMLLRITKWRYRS